jgi:hypothetical protein
LSQRSNPGDGIAISIAAIPQRDIRIPLTSTKSECDD